MTYSGYTIGYISAWLDTDGFLSVRKGKTNLCFGEIVPERMTFQPLIGFTNTNKENLIYLQKTISSHGIIQEIDQDHNGHFGTKPLFRLVYVGQQAINILKEVNLVGKAKQQRLLLEVGRLKEEGKKGYLWQHDKFRWGQIVLRMMEISHLIIVLNQENGGTEYYL